MIDNNKVNNAIHINTIKALLSVINLYSNDSRAKEVISELEYIRDESNVDRKLFDDIIENKRQELRLCPLCNGVLKSVFYLESHGEQMAYFQCSCGWNDMNER